jgi:hypothetical protein
MGNRLTMPRKASAELKELGYVFYSNQQQRHGRAANYEENQLKHGDDSVGNFDG